MLAGRDRSRLRRAALAVLLAAGLLPLTGPGAAPAGAAPAKPRVLVVAWGSVASNADVHDKLFATGRFATVGVIDASAATPSASTLADYDAVLTYSNGQYSNPTLLGDRLADYVDAGGHVVVATFGMGCTPALRPLARFEDEGYAPLVPASPCSAALRPNAQLRATQPHHPLLHGVESLDIGTSGYRDKVSLRDGSTLIATWDDGMPLAARHRTRSHRGGVVALNFFPLSSDARADFWDASTDGVTLLANALTLASPTPIHAAGFPDVPSGAFYGRAVDWAKSNGVTTGVGGTGRYQPDDPVTRGQMATFLWRLVDSLVGYGAHHFADVPSGTFYEQALRWAKATGTTTGVGGTNHFAPNGTVTRGQMVTFLWRVAGERGGYPAHGFTDVPAGTFYEQALRWAKATGVTTGVGGSNRFDPQGAVTRGQMAAFLYRLASTPGAWATSTELPTTVTF